MKLIILFLSFFSILCQAFGQNNPIHNTDKNNLVEFSEVLEYITSFTNHPLPQGKVFTIPSRNNGYLLLVKSLEECHEISSEKKEFLDYAFKTFGVYEKAKDLFNYEVLVETDAGKFWFPIQNELLKFWTKELKSGDLALIYTRFYGSISNSEDSWILTINSFNAGYYDGLWEEALNCFNNGKDTIGLRCVKKLMSLDPKDGRNYAMTAMYYAEKGRQLDNSSYLTKADSLFSTAEILTPKYSYQYFQRAILKFYMGDYYKSWNYIEKARSLNDEHIESWFLDDLEAKYPHKEFIKTKNIY
jgi:tetratricopeptide (TPR) repeat protein